MWIRKTSVTVWLAAGLIALAGCSSSSSGSNNLAGGRISSSPHQDGSGGSPGASGGATGSSGATTLGGATGFGGIPSSGGTTSSADAGPLDFEAAGTAVTKVETNAQGVTFMEERLTSIADPGPYRRVTLLDNRGSITGSYMAPTGWSLIDFTLHPSGATSAVIATNTTVKLVRFDRAAVVSNELDLVDAQAPNDPYYDSGGAKDDNSLVPLFTRDAARVAAVGENLVLALRTGRNAVVAYRFDYTTAGGNTRVWRTLVEPGLTIFPRGITSGTFDTFGQLLNHWQVQLDADEAGNVAIGVIGIPFIAPIFAAHANYFNQPTDIAAGALLTRLTPDGQRLGTTLVDTVQVSELHGLRLSGNDIAAVGRVFSEKRDDGSGWNAYTAHVDRTTGALSSYHTLDVDRGEILFDVAPLASGDFLVAGAAGYSENPNGASVSEQTTPLLAVLQADGTLKTRLDFPAGPRQNQLRSLATRGNNWLLGGFVNGPGTHSADGDLSLITADGFAREMTVP